MTELQDLHLQVTREAPQACRDVSDTAYRRLVHHIEVSETARIVSDRYGTVLDTLGTSPHKLVRHSVEMSAEIKI